MHSLPGVDSRTALPKDKPAGEQQLSGPELNPLTFGITLRRLREEQRLSLSDLADLVFYSKGYLSKVENGEKPPTLELATQCDEVLGTGGNLVRLVPQGRRRPDGGGSVRPAQLTGRPARLHWPRRAGAAV